MADPSTRADGAAPVFISYARADNAHDWVTAFVGKLSEQYLANGSPEPLPVFFYPDSIREGDDWERTILSHLQRCRAFVAVLSPDYFASDWCRREWDWWTRHEMHRHCLRDGAAPVYYVTVDGFPSPKTPRQIADWIVARNLRPRDPASANRAAIELAVTRFLPRQAYDLRPFTPDDLRAMAVRALKDRLVQLSTHVRGLLDRERLAGASFRLLPAYNPDFTGRIDELTDLNRHLAHGIAGITAVVQGLGGVGKTELALAYAHAYAHEYPGGRFLIPCAGAQDWRGVLDRLAEVLNAAQAALAASGFFESWEFGDEVKKDAAAHFGALRDCLHQFAGRRGRILLICDNVEAGALLDNTRLLDLALQGHPIHLLLSTRLPAPEARPGGSLLHWCRLDVLPIDDATELLEKLAPHVPPAQRTVLRQLAEELGGFTIAVELAGRHLAAQAHEEPARLLTRLHADLAGENTREAGLSGDKLINHRHEARLGVILEETLRTLAVPEIRALEYAAQMAPDIVPLAWLRQLLGTDFPEFAAPDEGTAPDAAADAEENWRALMLRLHGLRLLYRPARPGEREEDASLLPHLANPAATLCIHRLVQDFLRARSGAEAENRRLAVDNLVTQTCYFIREHWHEPPHRWLFPILEAFADAWLTRAEHGEHTLVKDAAFVANDAYGVLKAIAEWHRAEALLRRVWDLVERNLGPDSAELATTLNNLAQLLQATNRLAEAEPLMRRALAIDEATHGKDHPDVAIRLNNLAMLLQATNRLAEAEPLLRRALTVWEKALGADHPNVASALDNLAQLLQDTNRLAEAEPLIRRALAIDEATHGKDHPNVAIHLNNLARLLQATNRLAEAEPLMRRALAIDEASFGKDHPKVAIRLNNLATLLKATNRLAEAEPLMHRALAIDEASFGKDHPDVAIDLNNLAQLLKDTNRLAEAEPLMRRALAIDEASFGKDHPNVAIYLNNLAQLLQDTNRLAQAEPLMRRMVIIFAKFTAATAHEHPHLRAAMDNYGGLLTKSGQTEAQARERVLSALREGGMAV